MANVLIVSGSYFPHATANAVCAKEFENILKRKGHKVYYAIRSHDIDTPRITEQDGVQIYHIEESVGEFYGTCEKLKKVSMPQPLRGMFRTALLLIRLIMHLYSGLFFGTQRKFAEKSYLKEYAKTIKYIVEEKNIDVIISVSMPFLSHKAVLAYLGKCKKEKRPKWIAYMIDAYSQKVGADNVNEKIKDEMIVLNKADKTILLSVLQSGYNKAPFDKYKEKMEYMLLPLFNLDETNKELPQSAIAKDGFVDCVFAGTLYDETSPLAFFCDFVRAINDSKIRFHFLGKIYPNNLNMLKKLQDETNSEIVIYGFMPYDFAQQAIKEADVVINIGNSSIYQIPSKIFQYMSLIKPILTFYRIKDDTALPYLEKYPMAFNIFEESGSLEPEQLEEAKQFIFGKHDSKVSRNDLKEIYKGYTSDDVCEEFYKIFLSL